MSMPSREISFTYLRQTISLAKQSPPKPSNFRVGCVIVAFNSTTFTTSGTTNTHNIGEIISTGYTLELPGNTHAEQCALSKLETSPRTATTTAIFSGEQNLVLYTSLEPCGKRLSGNLPCVERIIATRSADPSGGIRKVVFGAKEPGTFVTDSQSCRLLSEAGIEWEYLPEFEDEILRVAMEGHVKDGEKVDNVKKEKGDKGVGEGTGLGTGSGESAVAQQDRARAEAAPRNPKKRMMEVPLNE